MQKTITTRRVFALAPYNTLEVIEQTADIPEHLIQDKGFISTTYALQLFHIQLQYSKYMKMLEQIEQLPRDQQEAFLEDLRSTFQNKFNSFLQGK